MRACATASAILTGLVLSSLLFAACSGNSSPQPPPQPDGKGDAPTTVAPTPTGGPTEAPTAAAGNDDAMAFGRCLTVMQSTDSPMPDGGVPMVNATTAADAGRSERFDVSTYLYYQKRDAFRCCFELWGQNNKGQRGKIDLYVKIEKDGKVSDVHIKPNSAVKDARVEACMANLVKSQPYPSSPTGHYTEYDLPFDFKPVR